MTLLLPADRLADRRAAARGGLAPLAASLAADLDRAVDAGVRVPEDKARMTVIGGRCPDDRAILEFHPYVAGRHRCPRCGCWFEGDAHDEYRVVWYQLWIAERAVHAALLALLGDPGAARDRRAAFADRVLAECAARYLEYPNADNVLGPARPFFSTYLESIWTLYLAIALDLREAAGDCGVGGVVRERLLEPSARLIASYDEGDSNRQVWNDAAMLAAGRLLGDARLQERAVAGRSGLVRHLSRGLLADGTWPEGENYHLFAHRGLWYGVTLAERAGFELPAEPLRRFARAFATPFLTRLPDFTFPSRRDSQYGVTLRQWRTAEMAELGLARDPDEATAAALRGALAELYRDDVPAGDTGRWRATAEAEINVPPVRLDRASLGWRSLLLAREHLPPLVGWSPGSVLLRDQGFAVLRRDAGRLYVALDYGLSGGGHGHPDRLNLLLADGPARWLDDFGTGAYVDPSLHWYRSTLAHSAPLVDGRSQARRDGRLLHFEDRGAAGWVDAEVVGIAGDVTMRRTVVAMPDYVVDVVAWTASRDVRVELPFHAPGALRGVGAWTPADPEGGPGKEDGFDFLRDPERAPGAPVVRLDARLDGARAAAWVAAGPDGVWWRAAAPGAPGAGQAAFHLVRRVAARGRIATVWSLRGSVAAVRFPDDGRVEIDLVDGGRHVHARGAAGWRVELSHGPARSSIDLGGAAPETARGGGPAELRTAPGLDPGARVASHAPTVLPRHGDLRFELGEPHYRRSEPTWGEAGTPTALVSLEVAGDELVVSVGVRKKGGLVVVPADATNDLDNDPACTRGDGVQLIVSPGLGDPAREHTACWLFVPRPGSREVGLHRPRGFREDVPVAAGWVERPDGYAVRATVPLAALGLGPGAGLRLDVLVNETGPGRERRRGQLVLSGGAGEYVYILGDGHDLARLLPFTIAE